MKNFSKPQTCLHWRAVGVIAALLLMIHKGHSETELDEATLNALAAKPSVHIDNFVNQWASSRMASQGRNAVAAELSQLAIKNQNTFDHASLIRKFGKLVEPEFTLSVLSNIESTDVPATRSRLLQLLWESDPKHAEAIAKWLNDRRFAEDLKELAKKNPKLNESIANGAIPFRVCDIAFNVMQEIKATADSRTQRFTRSESLEARDARIEKSQGASSPSVTPPPNSDAGPLPKSSPPMVTPPSTTKPNDAKPHTPRDEQTSSTPWLVVAVLIVAALGLLWLVLKRRS